VTCHLDRCERHLTFLVMSIFVCALLVAGCGKKPASKGDHVTVPQSEFSTAQASSNAKSSAPAKASSTESPDSLKNSDQLPNPAGYTPLTPPANPRSFYTDTVPEENLRAAKKSGEEVEREIMRRASEGVDVQPSAPTQPPAPAR